LVDEKPVKNTRFSKVTMPNDLRPMDKVIPLSPGPGHYETEKRTSLMTKVETKNSIKSNFSDVASLTTKSTFSLKPSYKIG
jgi:hypothetical protein